MESRSEGLSGANNGKLSFGCGKFGRPSSADLFFAFDSPWLLAGLLLFVFWLRLVTAPGMAQGDDLAYSELAWRFSRGNFAHYFTLFYFRWLVFVPTAILFKLFGVDTSTALLWPIVLSVLNVWLVTRIVTRESTPRAGFIAGLLYSTFPLIALYGTFLEPATPLESATLLALFALQRSRSTDSSGWLLLAGFSGGATMLARETGGFVFLLLGFWLLREWASDRGFPLRKVIRKMVIVVLMGTLPLLIQTGLVWKWTGDPLLRVTVSRNAVEIQNQTEGMDPKDFWFYPRTLVTKVGFCNSDYFGIYGFLLAPLAVIGFSIRPKETALFMGWALAYLCFLSFAPSSWHPYRPLIRNIRYIAVIAWGLCATAALVIDAAWSRPGRLAWIGGTLLAAALLGTSLSNSFELAQAFSRGHAPYRRVARFLAGRPGIVYYSDFDVPLLYKFYSGYQTEHLRPITRLKDILCSGTLALPVNHHPDRYLLPYPILLTLLHHPPPTGSCLQSSGTQHFSRSNPFRSQN